MTTNVIRSTCDSIDTRDSIDIKVDSWFSSSEFLAQYMCSHVSAGLDVLSLYFRYFVTSMKYIYIEVYMV